MPQRPASQADFTFRVADRDVDEFLVTGFEGSEEIGRLFEFRVTLCSEEASVVFDELVGQPCTLEIKGASGSRFVNGIVRSFQRIGEGSSLTFYAAEIVPLVWMLTRRIKSRIFQEYNCSDMTIPGIIKKVLDDAGIPSDSYRFALQGEYETREYVVQYRESEMQFISRLMEEVGIFYFFEHSDEGHVLVLGDGPAVHAETPNDAEFVFRDPTGMAAAANQEFFHEVRDQQEIQIGAVTLDDYNFEQPKLELQTSATAEQFTSLEYSDAPGRYVDKAVGQRYAQVRLEEFQCQRHVQWLKGNVRALLPGFKFVLTEHPNEALNQEYLVTRLVHAATQPQSTQAEAPGTRTLRYEVNARTIPAEVPYRTPSSSAKSRIFGSQTAVVVGPVGEDLYTDKYGRVKVQYFWDREGQFDENSSRWTRVAQSAAGGGYGIMFLPRVGQEVVVTFLEGDPDQPVVTGCVYNSDQMPPYELPAGKTRSVIKSNTAQGGGGTNEIRFEDKKDGEQFLFHASRDMHTRVQKDRVTNVVANEHVTIGGDSLEAVGGSKHSTIGANLVEEIGANHGSTVGGSRVESVGGSLAQSVGANHILSVGSKLVIEAGAAISLSAGGSFITIGPAGITIQGTTVKINSGGAAETASKPTAEQIQKPDPADEVVAGRDTTYNKQAQEYEQLQAERMERQPASWVEIELTDDEGNPVPGETYEVALPDGTQRVGTLNEHGVAREEGIDPGNCEINFPRLDREGWRR